MLAKYRSVLSVPGSGRLFATGLVGRLPLGTMSLAVLLLVRGATRSYAVAGLAVGAQAFGSAAAAPILGRLIDWAGRGRVLVPAALIQGAVLVVLVLGAAARVGTVILVGLAGLAGASRRRSAHCCARSWPIRWCARPLTRWMRSSRSWCGSPGLCWWRWWWRSAHPPWRCSWWP